jgi:hypothetical protein
MRKRRNTLWIDACASACAVEGQPDALSKDWSSQSDPKRVLTNSSQVKADHALFSRLMIATETAPVSLNTVDIRNIRSDCLLMSSGSGVTRPLRSWLADRDKYLERDRGAATCSLTIAQKSPSNEHDYDSSWAISEALVLGRVAVDARAQHRWLRRVRPPMQAPQVQVPTVPQGFLGGFAEAIKRLKSDIPSYRNAVKL